MACDSAPRGASHSGHLPIVDRLRRHSTDNLPSPSRLSEDCDPPPWADLPGDLLANMVRLAGHQPALALTLAQICGSWRHSLSEDACMLRSLRFEALSIVKGSPRSASSLPCIVKHAATAGNVEACMVGARWLQSVGRCEEAQRNYMRAARMGQTEAQWRIGLAFYHGRWGLGQDAEEALLWLSRAARTLMAPDAPIKISPTLRRLALKECTHILGILHQDGDVGVSLDLRIAIKWFKISARFGCKEAERVLQSLFRSGQY